MAARTSRRRPKRTEAGVRERLVEAADRLFYQEGIRAVGIDRVLAEADAAKASLYSHFGSKDELVAAFAQRRIDASRAAIEAFVREVPPDQRVLRSFDWVVAWTGSREFRGCPLQHIAGELCDPRHPARTAVATQRKWLYGRFLEWTRAAGAADPETTAGALLVLFDGAVAASEQDGPLRAREARWAAERLLDAQKAASRSSLPSDN